MEKKKIRATFIFEILGKPPEYIKETLSTLIDKLTNLKGIEIVNKIVHEPKPLKDEKTKNIFTTFAEVEILAEDFTGILTIMFNITPSSIEIIEPGNIEFSNTDLSLILTELGLKLHKYDEIVKGLTIHKANLEKQIKVLEQKLNEK